MSSKPIAAYAFVGKEYEGLERVIFGYLNKIIEIFQEKMGDKWKNFKEDQQLEIGEITEMFKKYQDPSKVDKLTRAKN